MKVKIATSLIGLVVLAGGALIVKNKVSNKPQFKVSEK